MEKKPISPIVSGLILSLIAILMSVIAYLTNIEISGWFRWVSLTIFYIGLIVVIVSFAKQSNYNVTFGNLFVYGFKTSAVVTCLMIVFSIAWMALFPEMKEKIIEEARRQMEQKQQAPPEQIDTAIEMTRKFFTLGMVLGLIFFYMILGALASLIGAALAKKNPQTPFQNQI